MSKNVIFCADGTWNGPGEADGDDKVTCVTNVFKIYVNLDGVSTIDSIRLKNEQERVLAAADGTVQQVAKYLHGVGDSDNFLVKALGGALGAGLITRIVRGYTFVSRNYLAGDKIFIVGFSRGAYTARALAGLIAAKGLLDATKLDLTNREGAYRLGAAVWYAHRRAQMRGNPDLLGRLEETVLDLPGFLTRPTGDDTLVTAPIEAVAVWDTVGALGIPAFNAKMMRVDNFRFADLALSPKVRHGLHAVAVDEQREDFTPTLWDADQRVTQVLFVGAHGDVGGGYPENDNGAMLSDAPLKWMTAQLKLLGVRFSSSPVFVPAPDVTGLAHSPWLHPPWDVLPRGSRAFPGGLALSQGMLDRIAGGNVVAEGHAPAPYMPSNLAGYVAGGAAKPGVEIVP
ncbi:MAG TPA: DUF2235 domain-containing protein [Xanthobacteraceae bacterium]|nr:DUF2235 domain-containing protein [Xanthobacteraceae bacterium]